ncbi:MAG TPA: transglutaminase family protein [Rhizobiaceae bacterium]|nr:transglutaminase family protein [Rhizobiaceae bacterium]
MHIEIDHKTVYSYEHPAKYGVQEFRLTPVSFPGQKVISWVVEAPGIHGAASYIDAFGNTVHLVNQVRERSELTVRVHGIIETSETGGIVGHLRHEPSSRIFLRETELTKTDGAIEAMAAQLLQSDDMVAMCHALMQAISGQMRYDTSTSDSATTAAQAFAKRSGVCQDFTHVFIAACRSMGLPARYVTGYLFLPDEPDHSDAHHAWAEVLIKGLGWVGFDPTNAICPDERYVRLACGPDATQAAPVRGLRRGPGEESLKVSVSVTKPEAPQTQGQSQQ